MARTGGAPCSRPSRGGPQRVGSGLGDAAVVGGGYTSLDLGGELELSPVINGFAAALVPFTARR